MFGCRSLHPAPGRAGFTLIEMLIVITIIAVLAGLLLPVIGVAQRKGAEATSRSLMSQVETGISQFYAQNQYYPGDDAAIMTPVSTPSTGNENTSEYEILNDQLARTLAGVMPDEFALATSASMIKQGGRYLLVDAWQTPLRYRPYTTYPLSPDADIIAIDQDPAPRPESYQLWSLGSDTLNDWGAISSDDLVNWR